LSNLRFGIGYDVHAFCEGSKITLGGIDINFHKSLKAHSDGDVLLHAICDALLGAAALGDIGLHFPDNSNDYKNISSIIILKKTLDLLKAKNYLIVNIDSTIIAERPRIMPHTEKMRKIIAEVLNISIDCVSIKATTNEQMGFIGREEGIAAMASALIIKGKD